jgi:hypothetical protein
MSPLRMNMAPFFSSYMKSRTPWTKPDISAISLGGFAIVSAAFLSSWRNYFKGSELKMSALLTNPLMNEARPSFLPFMSSSPYSLKKLFPGSGGRLLCVFFKILLSSSNSEYLIFCGIYLPFFNLPFVSITFFYFDYK